MRITPTVVETVAKYAAEFTGGAFQLQGIGGDIGHGTRYLDGIRMLAWVGRGASRQAAAYYIGGMLGWARHTGAEIPEPTAWYCQAVQETYQHTPAAMQWQQHGENDAESRVRRDKEGRTMPCTTTYTRTAGGRSWQIALDLTAYHADLKRAEEYGATVHHWDGEDRAGKPLHVAWIADGPARVDMRVHEVQHAADVAQEG